MIPQISPALLQYQGQILLHPSYTKYLIIQSQRNTNYSQEAQQQMLNLHIEFFIQTLESLRLQNQKNKKIFSLHFGNLVTLTISLKKLSHEFIFDEGRYKNQIAAHLKYNGKQSVIYEQQIKAGISKLVQFKIDIQQKELIKDLFCLQSVLQIGSKDADKVLKCKIKNFRLASIPIYKKTPSNFTISPQEGPLDSLPKNSLPPLDSLPAYCSPKVPSQHSLYFCHDMKGGYLEDTNISNPFPHTKKNHSYRCLHLPQCNIFNYFSHYPITIPPLHWRRLCWRMKKHCLGTFIVEGSSLKSEQYLTKYIVDLLVYLCKKYQFDGYLINIQWRVHDVNALIDFLNYLNEKIHKQVPNSLIIWYDSVSVHSGTIKYQNQVNDHNLHFYKICDGIFLNYWWNQQKLINSAKNCQPDKKIYVGSDCFGRNTYGGGGYDTFKAVNKIEEVANKFKAKGYDSGLIPALFAIGYTYQGEPQNNWELWKIQEKSMYRGITIKKQEIRHQNWSYHNGNVKGFTWKVEGEWAVTSFNPCKRIYRYPLIKSGSAFGGITTIKFMCIVQGTGPNFQDQYRVTIQVLENDFPFHEISTGPKITSQKQENIQLTLQLDSDLITETTFIRIVQEGNDAQKWDGHFGSRFKSESLYIMSYSEQKDWAKNKPVPLIELPYLTHFNLAHGNNFYYQGKPTISNSSYNFLSDMEAPLAYLLNDPLCCIIEHTDAFCGGTSLRVEGTREIVVGQIKINSSKLNVQLIYKYPNNNKQKGQIGFSMINEKNSIILKQQSQQTLKEGWQKINFSSQQIPKNSENIGIFKAVIKFQNENSILLGKLWICQLTQTKTLKIPKINRLQIKLSSMNPPISPYCFDLLLQLDMNSLLRIRVNDSFACFLHADQFNNKIARLENILCDNNKFVRLNVEVLNSQAVFETIMEKQFSIKEFQKNKSVKLLY